MISAIRAKWCVPSVFVLAFCLPAFAMDDRVCVGNFGKIVGGRAEARREAQSDGKLVEEADRVAEAILGHILDSADRGLSPNMAEMLRTNLKVQIEIPPMKEDSGRRLYQIKSSANAQAKALQKAAEGWDESARSPLSKILSSVRKRIWPETPKTAAQVLMQVLAQLDKEVAVSTDPLPTRFGVRVPPGFRGVVRAARTALSTPEQILDRAEQQLEREIKAIAQEETDLANDKLQLELATSLAERRVRLVQLVRERLEAALEDTPPGVEQFMLKSVVAEIFDKEKAFRNTTQGLKVTIAQDQVELPQLVTERRALENEGRTNILILRSKLHLIRAEERKTGGQVLGNGLRAAVNRSNIGISNSIGAAQIEQDHRMKTDVMGSEAMDRTLAPLIDTRAAQEAGVDRLIEVRRDQIGGMVETDAKLNALTTGSPMPQGSPKVLAQDVPKGLPNPKAKPK